MTRDPGARAQLTARELLGCCVLAIVLALAMHWPLPLHLFQANTFWPLPDSLAFSDALVGYAPFGLIGSGTHAAVARYDVLFLGAYALCFAAAWLLARELGIGRIGAAVAGAAFAYAPWRLEQEGHMHVISSGGIALALFLLLRGYRRGSGPTIVAGWLVAAWQFSLGFTLGLPFAYLLAGGTL